MDKAEAEDSYRVIGEMYKRGVVADVAVVLHVPTPYLGVGVVPRAPGPYAITADHQASVRAKYGHFGLIVDITSSSVTLEIRPNELVESNWQHPIARALLDPNAKLLRTLLPLHKRSRDGAIAGNFLSRFEVGLNYEGV